MLSWKKRLAFTAIPMALTLVVVEVLATAVAWFSWWDTNIWIMEDTGRTVRFGPIRGVRLTRTPSRLLRVTNGRFEYVGAFRGNNQGFPDRDDFGPSRTHPGVPRIAVLGDSFTAAEYLGQNWPDRAEDLAREAGTPVKLLNFAQSGTGLGNWWSLLTRLIEPEGYDVDGFLFAVYAYDLRRKFTFADHRDNLHLIGRAPQRWDPTTYPATLKQARSIMKDQPLAILSPEGFERVLQGHWPRGVARPFRPYLLHHLAWRTGLNRLWMAPEKAPPADDAGKDRLIADIHRVLEARHVPTLVVYIPDRAELVEPGRSPEALRRESEAFARAIGARFLDGGRIYEGLTRAEIRGLFLPHDGHWNQAGSNRFAAFALRNLQGFSPPSRGRAAPGDAS